MKNIICSLCFVFSLGSVASAQTQKGTIFINGNVGWNNTKNNFNGFNNAGELYNHTEKINNITVQPMIGTFVSDNLALGLLINYSFFRNKNEDLINNYNSNKSKTNSINIGPFIRKFFPLNANFTLYAQGNIGLGLSSTKSTFEFVSPTSQNYKSNSFLAGLQPGILFFATNKIGIDLFVSGFKYSRGKVKGSETSSSSWDADFDLPNLNLGLNLYLSR